MTTKYILTAETKTLHNGGVLHRIKATCNFNDVIAGDLGGWIEKETNLSREGNAWVYGNALVSGNALVYDTAHVCGTAHVSGTAPPTPQLSTQEQVFAKIKILEAKHKRKSK